MLNGDGDSSKTCVSLRCFTTKPTDVTAWIIGNEGV